MLQDPLSFRSLSPLLRYLLWLQILSLMAAGGLIVLWSQQAEAWQAIACALCASLSPLACAVGFVVLLFEGTHDGPWAGALIVLALLSAVGTFLVFVGSFVGGGEGIRHDSDLFLGLSFYISIVFTPIAFLWGLVAAFDRSV